MAIITSTGLTAEIDTQALDRLLSLTSVDGKREKEVQKLINRALKNARDQVSDETRQLLTNDERESWRAVKYSIYKQILGGNVSILQRKKRKYSTTGPDKPSRRGRVSTTERLNSYWGEDRSFILRIMNALNNDRVATHMDGHSIRRGSVTERPNRSSGAAYIYKSQTIGYRGRWGSNSRFNTRGFFTTKASRAIANAANELAQLLCNELTKEINKY